MANLPQASLWKWVWPENENTVNLKSASFIVIMLLHEGLTHIHSQKKPKLNFGESFTLSYEEHAKIVKHCPSDVFHCEDCQVQHIFLSLKIKDTI